MNQFRYNEKQLNEFHFESVTSRISSDNIRGYLMITHFIKCIILFFDVNKILYLSTINTLISLLFFLIIVSFEIIIVCY
jgi:hypothetical protein